MTDEKNPSNVPESEKPLSSPSEGASSVPQDGKNIGEPELSSLGKLDRELYSRQESEDVETRITKLRSTKMTDKAKEDFTLKQPDLVNVMDARKKRRQKIFLIVFMVIIVLAIFGAAAGATFWYRQTRQVSEKQISLTVDAPSEFTAGEHITYNVHYQNDSHVNWKNVELLFEPPQNFTFFQSDTQYRQDGRRYIFPIGDLQAGQNGELAIEGQLLGAQNEVASARFEMSISPENFDRIQLKNSEVVSTTIVSVPVRVSVEAAENAASGEKVVAKIHVQNTSSQPIEHLQLRLEPSGGMQLATEDQIFTEGFSVLDGWWELPTLEPLADTTYNAVVYVDGTAGERRTLAAKVLFRSGEKEDETLLSETSHLVTISASELTVSQTFNDSSEVLAVNPGQPIKVKIDYKNIGTTGLSNIIVKSVIEGVGFNAESLKLQGGAYNPADKTITWTSASVPQLQSLQPQQGGTLEYQFLVLAADQFPSGENDKNQAVIITSSVDSTDLPTPVGGEQRVISSRTTLPINTELIAQTDAFYDDGRLGIRSEGPLPPEVGKQTTYTLRFRLGSTVNDVGDVQLRATLPDGVRYTGQSYTTATGGEFTFNDRTQEIVWNIPQIEGFAGRTKPGPELHVQVAITPGENLRGERVPLLQSAQVEATDLYTDQHVTKAVTPLPTTETASKDKGTVQ